MLFLQKCFFLLQSKSDPINGCLTTIMSTKNYSVTESVRNSCGQNTWRIVMQMAKNHLCIPSSAMISTYYFLYSFFYIIFILISSFQKPFQLLQKFFNIKRNRTPNMNQIILRLLQSFLRHQLLFIQLLARPKPSSCQDRNNFFSEFFHKTMNYCIILKNSIKKRVPDFSETLLSIIFLLFLLSHLPIQ